MFACMCDYPIQINSKNTWIYINGRVCKNVRHYCVSVLKIMDAGEITGKLSFVKFYVSGYRVNVKKLSNPTARYIYELIVFLLCAS